MMLWICICLMVATAIASPSGGKYACCTPSKWEGKFCELGSYDYHHHLFGYADYSSMSYDGDSEQIAVDMHYISRFKKGEAKFILNFKSGEMYIIYDSKCKIKKIAFPFKPSCISGKAKVVGKTYLGLGKNRLNITSYELSQKGKFWVKATVNNDCIPVGELVAANIKGVKIFKDIDFFGFTGGIKDPKVFEPPASCKHEDDEVLHVQEHVKEEFDYYVEYFTDKFSNM